MREKHVDVVVIGAGSGGLGAALYTSKKGMKTLVIERHNLLGGAVTSFVRGRFEFEAALHEACEVGPEDNRGSYGAYLDAMDVDINWVQEHNTFHMVVPSENTDVNIPTDGIYMMATANDADKISPSLRSHFMEIEVSDYTPEEKKVILSDFILPRVRSKLLMKEDECIFSDDALNLIVERNSGKTGVRSLEQEAERLLSHALYRMEVEGVERVVYDMDL